MLMTTIQCCGSIYQCKEQKTPKKTKEVTYQQQDMPAHAPQCSTAHGIPQTVESAWHKKQSWNHQQDNWRQCPSDI